MLALAAVAGLDCAMPLIVLKQSGSWAGARKTGVRIRSYMRVQTAALDTITNRHIRELTECMRS